MSNVSTESSDSVSSKQNDKILKPFDSIEESIYVATRSVKSILSSYLIFIIGFVYGLMASINSINSAVTTSELIFNPILYGYICWSFFWAYKFWWPKLNKVGWLIGILGLLLIGVIWGVFGGGIWMFNTYRKFSRYDLKSARQILSSREKGSITITRQTKVVGRLGMMDIIVNSIKEGFLKHGDTVTVMVPSGKPIIEIKSFGGASLKKNLELNPGQKLKFKLLIENKVLALKPI